MEQEKIPLAISLEKISEQLEQIAKQLQILNQEMFTEKCQKILDQINNTLKNIPPKPTYTDNTIYSSDPLAYNPNMFWCYS